MTESDGAAMAHKQGSKDRTEHNDDGSELRACVSCGERFAGNESCYGHEDATPEWPRFHTAAA